MKRAVVLLSGGIDSVTTTAVAKTDGFEIYAMSFDYGQRHRRELESAKLVAKALGVKKHLIIKLDLREIGGSALTDDIEVPKLRNAECRMQNVELKSQIPNPKSQIPITYVPARNTIFLSFALAFAETIGAEDIFIGANAVDYSGYPDCRPEFIRAFQDMANLATKAGVEGKSHFRINAPLINLTKAEIIKKGIELGVDYFLTWSCYDPQPVAGVKSLKLKVQSSENSKLLTLNSELTPCGRCDSCLLRAKGFREAGIEDPLILKVKA